MSDSLTVFGTDFTGVTGIKATQTGDGQLTYIRPTGTKSITSNGTGIDVTQYASVDVSVSGGGSNDFIVTVSWNSTSEMWEPDCTWAEYYAAIGAGKTIVVETDESYYDAIADGSGDSSGLSYRVAQTGQNNNVIVYDQTFTSSGTALLGVNDYVYPLGSKQITANGWDIDVAGYAYADVWVTPNLQAKTNINPSTSSQTVTADQSYDGLSSVQINAMPSGSVSASATKGTVSNHSISVTPKATVGTAGYLAAGDTTGTAVSVTASELVSGSETKTANGTYDVTNLASLVVALDFVTYYVSTSNPTGGNNGDIWLKTVS